MNIRREMINARDEYISLIKSELLGPGSEVSIPDAEHELITNAPHKRYSMGILFPQENKINSENDESLKVESTETELISDDLDILPNEQENEKSSFSSRVSVSDAEEDNLDEEIGLASQNLPSSMGINFFITENKDKIKCDVSFATYRRAKLTDCAFLYNPDNVETYKVPEQFEQFISFDREKSCLRLISPLRRKDVHNIFERDIVLPEEDYVFDYAYKLCDQLRKGFVRIPHIAEIELDFSNDTYIDNNKEIDGTTAKITALKHRINDNFYSITIMLVNEFDGNPNGTNSIHQPNILISSKKNNFCFSEYSDFGNIENDEEEEKSLSLLYRNKKIYATGLGTAVEWKIDDSGNGILYNDFFPQAEVPSMDFNLPLESNVSKKSFSMKYLSDLNTYSEEEKTECLTSVINVYSDWIESLRLRVDNLPEKYHMQARKNIDNCSYALVRMRKGIDVLANNECAWKSFLLANRSMYMQREQLRLQEDTSDIDRYPEDEELEDLLTKINFKNSSDIHFWRPFQLAFILMSINSIINDDSDERKIVDLIWFPTGGGKTEAYLGLTAFTIFFRRMNHKATYIGTTVIMRYTLRLLAAQQFTRAATLICACEYIRRDGRKRRSEYTKYDLGDKPITIGLWIGGKHTPNRNDEARKCLKELLDASVNDIQYTKNRYNKFQVLKCPWCGTKMVRDKIENKLVGQWGYKMRNNNHFYMSCTNEFCSFNDKLPIQIVDEEIYKEPPTLLFGTVDKFAMLPWKKDVGAFFATELNNRAPELIIQDELHLISGPLGTMVGLYESAVDALCEVKGIKPKIVASTATIRRAKEQCSVLYNRDVTQFPSPGLDAEDSFFARESKTSYEDGIYGRKYIGLMPSGKTKAMMEVRTIAALLQKIYSMELSDEIKDKYWTLTVYFNSLKDLGKCSTLIDDDVKDFIKRMVFRLGNARDARRIAGADELTSRVSTTELNETLDKLEKLNYSQDNIKNRRFASNTLLATNMISVGIDVARLNVMLLVGQPKLTSEYIQASSRIGRSYPGIAFALYDGSKSRDRSHYEQFKPYHESFYLFVEPTGATPFSKPARDRALHAVLVAVMRHIGQNLLEEDAAINFDKQSFEEQTKLIKNFIIKRTCEIADRSNYTLKDESTTIAAEIDEFFDIWDRLATVNEQVFYGEKFMVKHPAKEEKRLLKQFNTAKNDLSAIDTMTSMRNVDSMVASNILVWED